jgi:hypothetical protein
MYFSSYETSIIGTRTSMLCFLSIIRVTGITAEMGSDRTSISEILLFTGTVTASVCSSIGWWFFEGSANVG